MRALPRARLVAGGAVGFFGLVHLVGTESPVSALTRITWWQPYRREWRSFLLSAGFHFAGRPISALEAFLILSALGLPASLVAATVIEAFGSGVRFATFFVPASLGALEGANAGAFGALGWTATAGLAFSVGRRARQVVWIGVGVVILLATDAPRLVPAARLGPVPSGGR
jgi:hypothetical protein